MHRIDGAGATGENQFTEGDPTQAVPATTVTAAWLNALQEEIAGAIEDAELELDKEDNTQLLAAIAVIAGRSASSTGDVKLSFAPTASEGWIVADDGSIGSGGSAATTLASDDAEALYKLLWNSVSDAWAPVSGGRGGSADNDWTAGKTLTVPRMLGRTLAVAGEGASLTSRSLGQWLGEEEHELASAEMPTHSHGPGNLSTNNPGNHTHGKGTLSTSTTGEHFHGGVVTSGGGRGSAAVTGGQWNASGSTGLAGDHSHNITGNTAGAGGHTHSVNSGSTGNAGGGGAHNNMQPSAFLHAHIKL